MIEPRDDRPPSRLAVALRAAAARARAATPSRAYMEKPAPPALSRALSLITAVGEWASATLVAQGRRDTTGAPPVCHPGGPAMVIRGEVQPDDAKTYLVLPFEVRPGTTRVEVEYDWEPLPPVPPESPLTQTVFDLGLWDEKGYRAAEGFRGWSGSRLRRVFVQGDEASRGYRAGPIQAGIWHVELGVGAVGPTGAGWRVSVRALRRSGPTGPAPASDPVDANHVARPEPGWYHGDFHMHAWHSHPEGPTPEQLVEFARQTHLDFLPVTEYVVGHHWDEYGAAQRAHPELVVWPGREIVTYFGHVQCLGETPGFIEYRHGFEDVNIRDIQTAVRSAGALFQVNHPTTFPPPLFESMCRGCAFQLGDEIDWDAVDTIEVLTGGALVSPRDYEMPDLGKPMANPFMSSAIDLWETLLNQGHRVTAVCGSDDKLGPGLGSSATAVYARELSRPALIEAIRAGRAYVRTRGVAASPALELAATAAGQEPGTFGSTFVLDGPDRAADVTVTVAGGKGQSLRVVRNGNDVETVTITGDPFEHRFSASRVTEEGPLGTWYRVETFDARGRTTIANPIFLQGSSG